jgi:hypothetical protein
VQQLKQILQKYSSSENWAGWHAEIGYGNEPSFCCTIHENVFIAAGHTSN